MTTIEAGHINIAKTAAEIFAFLVNCNNHKELMPEQVINWQSTENNCSFTIKGTADLALKIKETTPNTSIVLEPDGKKPFDFELKWTINDNGDTSTVNAVLEADLNMFLKMVAAKPLENFLHYQTKKLKTIMNG
jgi:carbon monoxide dehydrogenase subunit G